MILGQLFKQVFGDALGEFDGTGIHVNYNEKDVAGRVTLTRVGPTRRPVRLNGSLFPPE